jgi:pimeloyl-ACP methyl ester carboxylesterase
MVEQVAIAIPIRVGMTGEHVGDLVPSLPSPRGGRDQACRETAGDRDLDLLAALDASNELGGVLTKFTQPDGCHEPKYSTSATRADVDIDVRAGLFPAITDDTVDLIELLVARFGQQRLLLLGHSWGGLLTAQVAARRPDLLHGADSHEPHDRQPAG